MIYCGEYRDLPRLAPYFLFHLPRGDDCDGRDGLGVGVVEDEERREFMNIPATKDDAFDDIIALGCDYDNAQTIDDFKMLVDDIVNIASLARLDKYYYTKEEA